MFLFYFRETGKNSNEQEAKNYLIEHNEELARLGKMEASTVWNYMTNLTDENAKKCVINFANLNNYY